MKVCLTVALIVKFILLWSHIGHAKDTIKVTKPDMVVPELVRLAEKDAPSAGIIEKRQISQVEYGKLITYIVPVKINSGDDRGCYLFSYDSNSHFVERIKVATLEELEACEAITSISACNAQRSDESGLIVIYSKRLGRDNIWSEGTFVTLRSSGDWNIDPKQTGLITDIDAVANAKKRLKCLSPKHR